MSLLSPEEIGDLLKGWRKEARLSQEALEAATGVGQKTLSLMEKGKSLTLENVWAILSYYQKGPEALTKGSPRNAPESPRSDPAGAVPLNLHLAVVAALERAERIIQTLERTRVPGDLPLAKLAQLREDAERAAADDEGDASTRQRSDADAPLVRGTRRRRHRQHAGSKGKP